MKISKRAGAESSQSGVDITTTARLLIKKYWASQGNDVWANASKEKINDWLGSDFGRSTLLHLFRLRSGEIAEIRKSSNFYYVAKRSGGGHTIISLQPNYKEPNAAISQKRLETW